MTTQQQPLTALEATRRNVASIYDAMTVGATIKINSRSYSVILDNKDNAIPMVGIEGTRGAVRWIRPTDCGLGFISASVSGKGRSIHTPADITVTA